MADIDRAVVALWCRELGTILKLEVPAAAALGVVAHEIAPMAEVSMSLLAEVESGQTLADGIGAYPEVFPPLVRAAALAGERIGQLPQALLEAASCLERAEEIGVEQTTEERLTELAENAAVAPAVALSRRLLLAAIERDAREMRVTGGRQGGAVEVKLSGAWRVLQEVGPELFGPLCRRLKLMAQIPYWIAEPAVGSIFIKTPDDEGWDVAVRTIPDERGAGQSIDMTLTPRSDRHEPA